MQSPENPLARAFWCIFFASGLISTLIVYGVLQERIMQISYDGELFEYSIFLVLLNRLAAVIFSVVMAVVNGENLRSKAPLWRYATISLANVYSSTCQYEALKYVSFAVQMLGKSFKMMPVMLWGMVINGKSYGMQDWMIAGAVTGGVTEFLMTGPTASANSHGNSMKGFMLLLAFLALDGIASTMQEKVYKEYKSTKFNQMMYVNGISSLTSLMTLLVTGTLVPATTFFFDHPAFAKDAMWLSLCAVASQWFIQSMIKEFGALVFAATMNVRQIASIIVSYVTYHHHITPLQVGGLLCTFGAIAYKSISGLVIPHESAAEKLPLTKKHAVSASGDKH